MRFVPTVRLKVVVRWSEEEPMRCHTAQLDDGPPPSSRLRPRALTLVVGLAVLLVAIATPAGAGTVAADAENAVRPIVFPVAGAPHWSDTFGACRGTGCSRSHEGADILAPKLTELFAARDAVVSGLKTSATPDGSSGNYVILRDRDGWEYWYIHLNNDTPGTDDGANPPEWIVAPDITRGASVRAGQLVGFLGDSGNAESTAPHLHFEIHKPDGTIINPTRSLQAATTDPRRVSDAVADRYANFVRALSADFLGRTATSDEVASRVSQLQAGAPRDAMIGAYARSDEWIGHVVDGLYRSTLGRAPDASGRSHWISVLRNGATVADVGSMFYASDEYFTRAGSTNAAWVTDLYAEILGRQPDASGHAHWTGLADRGESRLTITAGFYGSIESRTKRVAGLYRDLLGRKPDASGHAYWAGVLANGRDIDLATFIAGGVEYETRAQRRFG